MLQMLLLATALQTAALPSPDFTPERWTLVDPGARVMPYLGRQALFLARGIALMNDVAFGDGAIEFDVALHGNPSFAGVVFRAESDIDYELIYVRPQRSRQPDALQYSPMFGDQEAWQLYYGAGYTAAAELPVNRWVHVRLVVAGYSARVYVDNAAEPQLVVTDLKRRWARGRVGLWGRSGGANFSNFSVTPAATSAPAERIVPPPPTGTVAHWRVSPAFDATVVDPLAMPAGGAAAATWEQVATEPSGVVNIARYRRKVTAGRDVVFAKTTVRSARAQRVRLTFGYSDEASIFLNGRLLFNGDAGYLTRDAVYLGTLTLGHDAVYLDLVAGDNELMIGVTEAFGGWGLAARVEPASAVTIE
jgi:hypothetical protein